MVTQGLGYVLLLFFCPTAILIQPGSIAVVFFDILIISVLSESYCL